MGIDPSTAFVSYSREDWEFVLRLAKDLKAKGAKVWMDKLDIRPGQRWEREVETALKLCSRMLVILSPASVGSSNVLAEAAFAIEEGKEVIPVLYLDCKVPFRLRPFQYADFRTSHDEGLQELLETLGSDRAAAVTAAATPIVTTTPAAPLAEHERKAAEDRKRQEELDQQRLAAEQARLEEERKQATAEKARLEQEGRERKAAEDRKRQEELERQRLAAERARLEEERKQATAEKARLEQEGRERSEMTSGAGIQDSVRAPKAYSAPLLIAGIVGALLIVGLLIYRAFFSGQELLTLRGHTDAVDGVAYSPDGKRLATASWDKTAKVWDALSGQELLTLRGHTGIVHGVAYSPDGKRLATASGDKTAKVWDAVSGQELLTLRGHTSHVHGWDRARAR